MEGCLEIRRETDRNRDGDGVHTYIHTGCSARFTFANAHKKKRALQDRDLWMLMYLSITGLDLHSSIAGTQLVEKRTTSLLSAWPRKSAYVSGSWQYLYLHLLIEYVHIYIPMQNADRTHMEKNSKPSDSWTREGRRGDTCVGYVSRKPSRE